MANEVTISPIEVSSQCPDKFTMADAEKLAMFNAQRILLEQLARINMLDIKCHEMPEVTTSVGVWNGIPEERKAYIVTCPVCKRWVYELDSLKALELFASGNTPWMREQREQRRREQREQFRDPVACPSCFRTLLMLRKDDTGGHCNGCGLKVSKAEGIISNVKPVAPR